MKLISFSLFLCATLALLDSEPDCESGFRDPIESGSDPDPQPVLGSGIRCFLIPRSRIRGKKSGSGTNSPDNFSESLETVFGRKFFDADSDPGSEIFLTLDPGWKNSDPE